jgi:hypothetical protein
MLLNLEKIHPKFRQITDLLFLSDKTDINLSNYKSLLRLNSKDHLKYLMNQFEKSSHIFWENGEKLWAFRLKFLFSLKQQSLTEHIQSFIEKRFFNLLKVKSSPNPQYDIEFYQFIEYCKYYRVKKYSLSSIREEYLKITAQTNIQKLIQTTKYLIPYLFKDINEYGNLVMYNLMSCVGQFELLKELKDHGYKYNIKPIVTAMKDMLFNNGNPSDNYITFTILNDKCIQDSLKSEYKPENKDSIVRFLEGCDFSILDEKWIRNTVNIINVAPNAADDIAAVYIKKLYENAYSHKRASADRIIRLLKKCPTVSPKKVLVYLANKGKMADIKLLIGAYPELKKLSAFI